MIVRSSEVAQLVGATSNDCEYVVDDTSHRVGPPYGEVYRLPADVTHGVGFEDALVAGRFCSASAFTHRLLGCSQSPLRAAQYVLPATGPDWLASVAEARLERVP